MKIEPRYNYDPVAKRHIPQLLITAENDFERVHLAQLTNTPGKKVALLSQSFTQDVVGRNAITIGLIDK